MTKVPPPHQTGPDPMRGWPSPSRSPGTFEGQLEQLDKITSGLRARRTGWRALVARIGLGALVLAALVIAIISATGTR